jgi:hypothetical protein
MNNVESGLLYCETLLVFPKTFESVGRHFGVSDGMSNILVPEVMLQGSGVMTFISKFEAAGVSQHVRMDRKRQFGCQPRSSHKFAHIACRHGAAALRDKQIGTVGPFPPQLTQGSKLRAPQGVSRRDALFQTLDGEETCLKINLFPPQTDSLTNAKTMAVHNQQESTVSMTMATRCRGGEQRFDFSRSQIFPTAQCLVAFAPRWPNFPVFGVSDRPTPLG